MKDIKGKKINKKMITISSIVLVVIILITTVICLVTKKDENVEVENTGRIQKQAMNPNNYTMVKSRDGIDVPVPKGYTASSVESESYVNGTFETLYLNKNLTDTFASGGTYLWSKNDSEIWTSGNYNIDSSTSEMTSEEFTVSEDGGILQLNWTVSSQLYYDYLYGEIINTTTNSTEKTTIKLNGTYYGTSESNIIYMNTKVELNQGTYKLKIIYSKNASTNKGLDKGYVKEVKIYDRKNNGNTDTIQNHKYGGFVIYEGTEEVTDSNQWTAQCERNQWVWIPIEDVSDMYWEDKTDGKLYGTYYNGSATSYTKSTSNRKYEPQLTRNDMESTYLTQYLGGISRYEFLMEMEQEFYEMLQSVATYGGFYIGRYEVGDLKQTTPVVKRMNTDIGNKTWYTMYKKCKKLSGANTNVKTSMIWGTQYDQVMNWLIKSGEKTPLDIYRGSVAWGNYSDVEFEYYTNTSKETATKNLGSGTRIASGAYEGARANNIYDLAGNVWLWTLEANSSGSGVGRYSMGGSFSTYGVGSYASNRGGSYPPYSYYDVGFSGGLYIK